VAFPLNPSNLDQYTNILGNTWQYNSTDKVWNLIDTSTATIGGSGTTNTLAKFTSATEIGDSVLTEDSGNLHTTGNFTADGTVSSLSGISTLNELIVQPDSGSYAMIKSYADSSAAGARARVRAGTTGDTAYMDAFAYGFSEGTGTGGPDGTTRDGGVGLIANESAYMQIDQYDVTKKLHLTVNNISKIIVDSTGAMITNIRPISGTVTNFANDIYTTGILSISGSPYVQGIFNVFKDSTNPFVAGIRKSCGNHQADGWLENTTSFNVELSGNGKLDVDPEYSLVILPEVTLASSNANRVWMGKIEISAVDPVNNETGFGLIECYGTFSSAGVVGEQALALPVYSGSTIAITDAPGAICVLVNSNPSATTSSSIAIKNNFTGTAIVTYTVRVCLCDPGTIPV
jgi:hypothetical protein